jgi:diguanylate cyclase (GGDEF)-like protein/PAS domain S-box-containing protein
VPTETGQTTSDSSLPKKKWLRVFGLASLRGRYLYLAVLFVLTLLSVAGLGALNVRYATEHALDNTGTRHDIRRSLREVTEEVWAAESALHNYMLAPTDASRDRMHQHLARAQRYADQLLAHDWVRGSEEISRQIKKIRSDLEELSRENKRVMDIRVDPQQLFPAMPTMVTRMLPAYTDFNTAATQAMDEVVEDLREPSLIESYRLFAEARYAMTQMIGAFRNWVANRFGAFGEAESAMRTQAHNIVFYQEMTGGFLSQLDKLDAREQLGAQQHASLKIMRRSFQAWLNGYRDVSAIYTSDRWRSDTSLLRETIAPLFKQVWVDLRKVDQQVDAFSAQDMSLLSRIADRLVNSMWLLALSGAIVTLFGYMIFEFTVRRPIARAASALRAEASGQAATLPPTLTTETNDLVVAFETMRNQIHFRQHRLETILDSAAEGIITFDALGAVQGFNRASQELFGKSETEVIGRSIDELFSPTPHQAGESDRETFLLSQLHRLIGREEETNGRHKDGSVFPVALKITPMILGGQQLYVGLVANISERKAMVENLRKMAEHDGLTGLYNRGSFQAELERVIARAGRSEKISFALLYIDLDNFKYVNDTLGHAAGDRLLIEVSAILLNRARSSDLVARFGGDEFTVLLYDTSPENAVRVADFFRELLGNHVFNHAGERIAVSCSIGVTAILPTHMSAEAVLSQADLACHLAKRRGRNRVHQYEIADGDNLKTMTADMGWSRLIREAIENDRFVLAAQPIVEVRTRQVASYEILVRLRGPGNEILAPTGFLPTAERFGLAPEIDRWVIRHAVNRLVGLRATQPELRFSINLSAQTLMDLGVCDFIVDCLKASGLDPGSLQFEVTETAAIADMNAAVSFLSRLQKIGCETALDDFGSGMASFAYLRDLPVDCVKIDGRFVKKLATNSVDQAMVKAMNEIAHALGKRTVAEFVEDEASFRLLAEFGVDYAQGYHLGRPTLMSEGSPVTLVANG